MDSDPPMDCAALGALDPCDVREAACFEDVIRYTQCARGLALLRPLRVEVVSPAEAQERQEIEKRERPSVLDEPPIAAFVRFGLVASEASWAAKKDEISAATGGFYLPGSDEVFLIERQSSPTIEEQLDEMVAVAHEVTHALQDQHFGLDALLAGQPRTADAILAAIAVGEGDAVVAEVNFVLAAHGEGFWSRTLEDIPARLPGFLEDALAAADEPYRVGLWLFPYVSGAQFVLETALAAAEPTAALDGLFERPPLATRMVLHRPQYLEWLDGKGEVPSWSDADFPTPPSYEPLAHWGLGEWGTSLLLRRYQSPDVAARAARGIVGDEIRFYQEAKGGSLGAVWRANWSTAPNAVEFASSYRTVEPPVETAPVVRVMGSESLVLVGLSPEAVAAVSAAIGFDETAPASP